jgi:hypothetical protein
MPYKDPDKQREAHRKLRNDTARAQKPTIDVDVPDRTATHLCYQCGERKPITHFNHLPADKRCATCIPTDVAHAKSQELIDLAHRKLAQILDANEKAVGLPALEQLIHGIYGAWGGVSTFCHDIKDSHDALVAQKKYHQALNAQLDVMKLHARVDKMRQEDDWRQMDDERLKESLQIQLMSLLADDEKLDTLTQLMKANGQDPNRVLHGIVSDQPEG